MAKINRSITAVLIFFIKLYQWIIKPLTGPSCRFHPSCSSYAIEAFQHCGWMRGLYLTISRLLRCHPWCKGGADPIPKPISKTKL